MCPVRGEHVHRQLLNFLQCHRAVLTQPLVLWRHLASAILKLPRGIGDDCREFSSNVGKQIVSYIHSSSSSSDSILSKSSLSMYRAKVSPKLTDAMAVFAPSRADCAASNHFTILFDGSGNSAAF